MEHGAGEGVPRKGNSMAKYFQMLAGGVCAVLALMSGPTGYTALQAAAKSDRQDIRSTAQKEIDQLWAVEAERRIDEVASCKVKTIPGEEVFRKVRERFGG